MLWIWWSTSEGLDVLTVISKIQLFQIDIDNKTHTAFFVPAQALSLWIRIIESQILKKIFDLQGISDHETWNIYCRYWKIPLMQPSQNPQNSMEGQDNWHQYHLPANDSGVGDPSPCFTQLGMLSTWFAYLS